MAVEFTKEQREVIDDRGNNLLVSASAGSGKTTVMIERILRLLLGSKNSKEPLSISNFLVVTFTKASASDMKQKLVKALSEIEADEFVLEQIEKVPSSDISNLHSFCSRLISTYFYEVGLDPAAFIVDDAEAEFLKNRALDRVFEKRERDGDKDFFELFDIFQKKRSDTALRDIIKRFDANLKENIDGKKWFEENLLKCYEPCLDKNAAAQKINQMVCGMVKGYQEEIEEFLQKCDNIGLQKMSDYLVDLSSLIGAVNFKNSFAVNAKNVFDISIKTAPKLDAELEEFEIFGKALAKRIKKSFENFRANFISRDEETVVFAINRAREILLKLYALVCEFDDTYEKLKREANSLDFHDLEHYALKILANDEICKSVRDKYSYVFVDEYQDINAVQEKIISLVSREDNRFMVGDVKQSIYRFRFCDPDIFIDKFARFQGGEKNSKLIKLNCNFRSDKKILKFVDLVFGGVMTDEFGEYNYSENAMFVPGDKNLDLKDAANLCFINFPKKNEKMAPQIGIYSVKNHTQELDDEQTKILAEAALVAEKIKQIKQREDVSFGDFAVLVSSRNEKISEFIEALKRFEIPVSSDKKYDLMQMKHIKQIVNFVKLSTNPNDDIVLFRVLKSQLFNFSDKDLAKIRATNKIDRFYEVLYAFDENDDAGLMSVSAKVKAFKQKLAKFINLAKIMQIKDFVREVIKEFDLKLIAAASENGEQKQKDIDEFVSKLASVDVFDYANLYSDYSIIKEGECTGDAIKVMTIHKSKGIEFKFVFLINLANEFNFKSTYQNVLFNKKFGVGINCYDTENRIETPSVAISAIRMVEKRKLVEEQQRVLYVAMTRAVEKLFVICCGDDNEYYETFSKRPKAFIDWFSPIIKRIKRGEKYDFLNFEEYDITNLTNIPAVAKNSLKLGEQPTKMVDWFCYKNAAAKNVPLKNSISKILASADDEAYETARFGEETNISSADRGTVYHKIFEKIDLFDLKNIDDQLDKIFEKLTLEEQKLASKNVVKNVFSLDFFGQIKSGDVVMKEREFCAKMPAEMVDENCKNDEFILQGVIDLLVLKQNEIWILDYKTGKYNSQKLEKYNKQIEAYANVVERAFGKKVTKKLICFVDEQKNILI